MVLVTGALVQSAVICNFVTKNESERLQVQALNQSCGAGAGAKVRNLNYTVAKQAHYNLIVLIQVVHSSKQNSERQNVVVCLS